MTPIRWALAAIVLLPCIAFPQARQQQAAQRATQKDPCDLKSEYEALLKKGIIAKGELPKPEKPLNASRKELTRTEAQQEIDDAIKARDKAAAELKTDQAALGKATQALLEFENRNRTKLSALHKDVLELPTKIRKAREAASKASPAAQQELAEFRAREVLPLETQITAQMPGVPFDQARVTVADFKDFDNPEIRGIKAAIKGAETTIANTNAKYEGKSEATITLDDAGRVDALKKIIDEQTALLPAAIERARQSVRQDIRSYDKKKDEYDAKLKQLFPDPETQKLAENVGALEAELAAKQQEIASINAENRKLVEARRAAVNAISGYTQNGTQIYGSEDRLRERTRDVEDRKKQLADVISYQEWEANDKYRTELIAKKTAYDQVVIAKNSEITKADQIVINVKVLLNNERTRLRAAELPKFTQSAEYRAAKQQLKQRVAGMDPARKAAEIKAFKEAQSAKLNAIVASLIQPIKDRENRRLTEVMTNLTPYRCWDDVKPWIAEAQRQMQQTASLVGGMDFNFMDTSGWEQMPYDDDVAGLPDVSGKWKASIGGIIRDIRQSGGRISWSADYQWGPIMRHEDMQGTVSPDGRIEVIITYTSPGERSQGGFSATVTVDSNGKATGIRWSNGDQYTRAP